MTTICLSCRGVFVRRIASPKSLILAAIVAGSVLMVGASAERMLQVVSGSVGWVATVTGHPSPPLSHPADWPVLPPEWRYDRQPISFDGMIRKKTG